MTNNDRLELLREAVRTLGSQAKAARRLGYSSATISQVLSGQYHGQLETFLTRVGEVFGQGEVDCPVMGEILYPVCVAERRLPFTTANPHRVRMYQQCRVCPLNSDPREED